MWMSQNMRATRCCCGRQGSTTKVAGSGRAIMSDSSMRAKPSIEEPSKLMPRSSAASSSPTVIANDFSEPRMSVNQSRMNLTSASRAVAMTYSVVSAAIRGRSLRGTCACASVPWPRPRPR